MIRKNAYGTHILYYFEKLDIINFNYKIKSPIEIQVSSLHYHQHFRLIA